MTTQDVIRFDCDNCGKSIKVPADNAGKKGRCPGCKEPITVPEPELELELAEEDNAWIDDLPAAEASGSAAAHRSAPPKSETVSWKTVFVSDIGVGGSIGVIAVFWIAFIASAVFGIDILGSSNEYSTPGDKPSIKIMLSIALISTAVLAPIALLRFKRTHRLLTVGVETPYEIIRFGAARQGMQDVTFEYNVNGKAYRKKMSINDDWVEEGFRLIVDPDHPKRIVTRPFE